MRSRLPTVSCRTVRYNFFATIVSASVSTGFPPYVPRLSELPVVSHHVLRTSERFPYTVYLVRHGFLLSPAIKHRCTLFQPICKETCIETDKLIRKPVSISLHRLATIQSEGTVLISFRTAIKKKNKQLN